MAKLKLTYPVFRHAAAVTCGTGSVRVLAELPQDAVFLTSGAPPVVAAARGAAAAAGLPFGPENHLAKPPGEPDAASVEAGARFLAARNSTTVVLLGGGSVLDWGRLAWAAGAGLLDPRTGHYSRDHSPASLPRFWLVPTTCGTGAEAADVAVFQLPDGAKRAVTSPAFMASRVILDGRFLDGLAPARLAAFVCDALSHALEGWLSLIPLRLGKEAAISALGTLLGAYAAAPSPSRQERLMEAGFQGGVAAANCSVGVVHAAAHALGVDGVPHGLANACCLIDGLRFNGDSDPMAALLGRLGLASTGELAGRLEPIVADALGMLGRDSAVWRLADPAYREHVAARMEQDVAIRTNPRRPSSTAELAGYLADVLRTVERLCPATS